MSKKQVRKNKMLPVAAKQRDRRIDEFVSFVTMFNKFINHKAKQRIRIIEKDMRM